MPSPAGLSLDGVSRRKARVHDAVVALEVEEERAGRGDAAGGAARELVQQGARGVLALVHAQEVVVVLEPELPVGGDSGGGGVGGPWWRPLWWDEWDE